MKKFIIFLLIVLLLCGLNVNYVQELSFKEIFAGCNVEVYLADNIDSEYSSIRNGEGVVVFCSFEDLDNICNTYSINGFTVKIYNSSLRELLIKLKPNYFIEERGMVYGYLNNVSQKLNLNNQINFQCVEVAGGVHIGFPILLGCY